MNLIQLYREPLSLNKAMKYICISIISLSTFFSCDSTNINDSSIDSSSTNFNNASIQSADWYSGWGSDPSETTNHAPQRNNMTNGELYHTTTYIQKFFNPLYYASSAILSNRPPSVVDNHIAYTTTGDNKIRFGIMYGNDVSSLIVPGAKSSTGPATVKYQGDFYIFHKGVNTNKIYSIKSTDGGNSWGADTWISGSKTNTIPSATVFNGKIYLFYKGANSNTIYYRYMNSSGSWSSESSLPSSESRTPRTPTIRTNEIENKLYLVYRGEDKYVYFRTMNTSGNWSSTTLLDPINSSPPKTKSAPDIYFTVSYTYITLREKQSNRIVTVSRAN